MRFRANQKVIIGAILALLASVVMAVLLFQDRLYGPQAFVNDLTLRSSSQTVDPRIVVVAIDDVSLQTYGRLGSWDRAHYAELIARLKDAGAKVAAFDVAFIDPTPRDGIVAQAIAYAQSPAGGTPPMPVILATVADGGGDKAPGQGLAYDDFVPVTQTITVAGPQLANVTVQPDGAVVRHLPLRAVAGSQHYFLLPLAAVNAFLGRPPVERDAKLGDSSVEAGGRSIPTDSSYRMLIDYQAPPLSYKHFSLSQVAAGQVAPSEFKDKLVFIGEMGSTSLPDSYPVPVSTQRKMDGVEIWANGAQNILDGKFVVPEDQISTLAFMLVLSGLGAAAFFAWGVIGWLVSLGVLVVYSGAAYLWTLLRLNSALGDAQVIPLPNIAYVGGDLLLTGLLLFVWFFVYEQRTRRTINNMFGKYVTPEVASYLLRLQEEGKLGLGGSVRDATIMFGDIRGFTTLSEGMEPEEVMAMLNRYFDRMVEIIVKHGGTISKFIGDNVMVLFNVPLESKTNHALAAARAGFEIQEWIREYRA
ncbi:MAG: adenylate/guanylate cyclase domain-containing protein, partial [Chloroflexi bacterium]|nr:adenylate/guanylate cyclase domain-containing protein [Chloroflexota bacterium]